MTMLSRRIILGSCGAALICMTAAGNMLPQSATGLMPLKVTLAREFSKKQILDVSPDGKKLCFENWGDAKHPMDVVELGTWKTIFSGSFQTRVWFAGFFSGSRSLIVETRLTPTKGKNISHLTHIDLHTGKRTEGQPAPNSPCDDNPVTALADGILLVDDINWKSIAKCSLLLVEFPTCREIASVPFTIKANAAEQTSRANSRTAISNDRSVFVYTYANTLVCRRSKDLKVLWTQNISPLTDVYEIATSSNGSHVAIATANHKVWLENREYSISIYDGETGSNIARFAVSGTDGIAISPDGRLLAVAEIINDRTQKQYFTVVHVCDARSGAILVSFEHDRLRWQRGGTIKAACRVYFTADGQYMISSGMNTKVWSLDRGQG